MAAVSHGARLLRQGIGVSKNGPMHTSRSIHIPSFTPRTNQQAAAPSTAQRLFSETRTFLSRILSHLTTPGLTHSPFAVPPRPSPIRPAQFSNSQSIGARFSLPVKHALSRPLSSPRLPKPPAIPASITHVGLGTARAFHSGRPIFQNMVDNVPIATRALWEAEWDVKMKRKEARGMRRAAQNKAIPKSQEMLKPKPMPVIRRDASEFDVYFPVEPTPTVTVHLLVPLAPSPTARLPLSTRADDSGVHPLLPISDLVSVHTSHRLHSLKVSTLFARLDAANVWDDPRVSVGAYAFGPRHDAQEKQCTVLRVTFGGWTIDRVRAVLGESAEEWYSLEETHSDEHPPLVPVLDPSQGADLVNMYTESVESESVEAGSSCAFEDEMDDGHDVISPLPVRVGASAQHDLVLPTLDFSSSFSNAPVNLEPFQRSAMFLPTAPELTRDTPSSFSPSSSSAHSSRLEGSWVCLGLSSSFLERVEDHRREIPKDMY